MRDSETALSAFGSGAEQAVRREHDEKREGGYIFDNKSHCYYKDHDREFNRIQA